MAESDIEKYLAGLDKFNAELINKIAKDKLSPEAQIDIELIRNLIDYDHQLRLEKIAPQLLNPQVLQRRRSSLLQPGRGIERRQRRRAKKAATERLKAIPGLVKQAKENLKTPPKGIYRRRCPADDRPPRTSTKPGIPDSSTRAAPRPSPSSRPNTAECRGRRRRLRQVPVRRAARANRPAVSASARKPISEPAAGAGYRPHHAIAERLETPSPPRTPVPSATRCSGAVSSLQDQRSEVRAGLTEDQLRHRRPARYEQDQPNQPAKDECYNKTALAAADTLCGRTRCSTSGSEFCGFAPRRRPDRSPTCSSLRGRVGRRSAGDEFTGS